MLLRLTRLSIIRFGAAQPRRGKQRRLRSQSGPQFASKPLVPETINPFRSRFVAAEDRSELRAKINIRNAALSSSSSSSSSSAQALPFTSTSHLTRLPPQPAAKPGFAFNFRVQH